MTDGDLRRGLRDDLDRLRTELVSIGRSVVESVPRATRILAEHDIEGAGYAISYDDEVDARTLDIEEECYQVLALQAPVASDLRQVAAAIRICAELERSADLVVNICRATQRLDGPVSDAALQRSVQSMGELAGQLLDQAVTSYSDGDRVQAEAVEPLDDELDELQRQFVAQIFESHRAGSIDLPAAVQLAMVARFYERIGDHAVNIGERVSYMVTGWLPEHVGAQRFRASQLAPAATDQDGRDEEHA